MTQMSVDEIHAVNLGILKHIHEFCTAHNIKYMLGYGTLIGAVRHKGFIPWDDDADIVMLREDYDKFLVEYEDSEKYRLYAPEKKNSLLIYGRVCEMKETFFKARTPWALDGAPGVGVDVFPLDFLPDDSKKSAEFQDGVYAMELSVLSLRVSACYSPRFWRMSRANSVVRNAKNFVHILLHWIKVPYCRIKLKRTIMDVLRTIRGLRSIRSGYVGNLNVPIYSAKERMPTQWFDACHLAEFCGERFFIPTEYGKILTNYYGDYMKLPQEDKRGGHASWQAMMWRNK